MKPRLVPTWKVNLLRSLYDALPLVRKEKAFQRVKAILLVAPGRSARSVAKELGRSPRTVEHWVVQFLSLPAELFLQERRGRHQVFAQLKAGLARTIREQPEKVRGGEKRINSENTAAYIRTYLGMKDASSRTVRELLNELRQAGQIPGY